MALPKVVVAGLVMGGTFALLLTRTPVRAQSTARAESGDAAVAALVTEVRALRADMAAVARNQLRAQLLLGRVQMQEQRLAYLDKQRSDVAAQAALQSQMTSALRGRAQGFEGSGCAAMPAGDPRRDCEAQAAEVKRQFAEQQAREQQLRAWESELTNSISTEQARWSEFNSRLDELERASR
jgi:hypothetical protein